MKLSIHNQIVNFVQRLTILSTLYESFLSCYSFNELIEHHGNVRGRLKVTEPQTHRHSSVPTHWHKFPAYIGISFLPTLA